MMKKKASGMISPPTGCWEELQIPRSRDDGGGSYRRFRGILIGCLGFRHRGILIGKEARQEGGQGAHTLPRHGLGWAHAWGLQPPCGAPLSVLWTPCSPQ